MKRLEVTANTAGCQCETFRSHGALRVLECGEVKPVGANRSFRVDVRVVTSAALKKLREHPWPGNVRAPHNVVQRALLLRKGPMLDTDVLTFEQCPELVPEAPGRARHTAMPAPGELPRPSPDAPHGGFDTMAESSGRMAPAVNERLRRAEPQAVPFSPGALARRAEMKIVPSAASSSA